MTNTVTKSQTKAQSSNRIEKNGKSKFLQKKDTSVSMHVPEIMELYSYSNDSGIGEIDV